MSARELCPHCVAVPMVARTNGFGGVYIECLDCGYYDAVRRRTWEEETVKIPRERRNLDHWTSEAALQSLRDAHASLGRVPTAREMRQADSTTPPPDWFRQRFGSLTKAVKAAGLTPRRRGYVLHRNAETMAEVRRKGDEARAKRKETGRQRYLREYWQGAA